MRLRAADMPKASPEAPGASLAAFGPPGQLVAPWAPGAQLGLDGRSYAPPASAELKRESPSSEGGGEGALPPPSGAAASLQLGLAHGISEPPPQGGQQILSFSGANWWERQRTFYKVMLGLGIGKGQPGDRSAKCHTVASGRPKVPGWSQDVAIRRGESGGYSISGLVTCGGYWCPTCGPRRARTDTATLGVAITRHLVTPGHDVWMLTPTIQHTADEPTADKLDRLYAAWDALTHTNRWRQFAKRHGVVGAVRVIDATHGPTGWHAHFHVALFVTNAVTVRTDEDTGLPVVRTLRELPRDERALLLDVAATERGQRQSVDAATALRERHARHVLADDGEVEVLAPDYVSYLRPAWRASVESTGSVPDAAFDEFGLVLTGGENAATYFVKWALADEVARGSSKRANPFTILDDAVTDERAAEAFGDWFLAIRGRTVVSGLATVAKRFAITDDDRTAFLDEQRRLREAQMRSDGIEVPLPRPPVEVIVRPYLLRDAVRVGWSRVFQVIEDADNDGEDPQRVLDAFLLQALRQRGAARTRAGPGDRAAPHAPGP